MPESPTGLADVLDLSRVEAGKHEIDIRRFEPRRILADDTMTAVVVHVEIAVRATGRVINDLELHLWTFDAQGNVARFRHVADTHQHWLALRG